MAPCLMAFTGQRYRHKERVQIKDAETGSKGIIKIVGFNQENR